MAHWITEWSIATMESKVFPSRNYYLFFIFIFCIYGGTRGRCSRSVLTCGFSVVAKTRMSLWKLVADVSYLFFRVPWLTPTWTAALLAGKEPHEVHLIRIHTQPCGGISNNGRRPKTCRMDYISQQVWGCLWTPPGVPRRGLRMGLGLWKCWHSLMDGWMDGFSNFLEAQTRINAAQWITYWETKTSAVWPFVVCLPTLLCRYKFDIIFKTGR